MPKSFADIYSQWESTHDESKEINKKTQSGETRRVSPTVSVLRKMKVQDSLDLHQRKLDDALSMTKIFLEDSWKKGLRKVRIITGKGIHSPNGESVLRPGVIGAVKASPYVREYDLKPPASEGGSGAVVVILKES